MPFISYKISHILRIHADANQRNEKHEALIIKYLSYKFEMVGQLQTWAEKKMKQIEY